MGAADKEGILFDPAEYEEQKFEELRPFMFWSGAVAALFILSLAGWDYAHYHERAFQSLKWRVIMSSSMLASVCGYLWSGLPRRWYFISVAAGMWMVIGGFDISSHLMDGGDFYRWGGFGRGLAIQIFLTIGLGRKQALTTLLLVSVMPIATWMANLQNFRQISYAETYFVSLFALCVAGIWFFDLLFRNIYMARKQLMAEKMRAERETLLKNQFISLVSHDLKGPLCAIRSTADLIVGDHLSPEETRQLVSGMKTSADSMLAMVGNLLNIGRLHAGVIKPENRTIALHQLVAEKMALILPKAKAKGISMTNDILEDAQLFADETLIGEVLANLLDNAVKFTRRGGTVTVSLPEKHAICVRDTGDGIPAVLLPHLFRHEIKTTKPGTSGEGGTGFGLPMSHDIVAAHGGTLTVQSEAGKGTAFFITLPELPLSREV